MQFLQGSPSSSLKLPNVKYSGHCVVAYMTTLSCCWENPALSCSRRHDRAQRTDSNQRIVLVFVGFTNSFKRYGSRIVDIIAFFTKHLRFKTACSIQSFSHKRLFAAVNHMAKEPICEIDFLLKKPEKTGYSGFHRTSPHPVCLQCESCLCR